MHSVKLSVYERDSVRSVGGMSESCAVLLSTGYRIQSAYTSGMGRGMQVFSNSVAVNRRRKVRKI